MIRPSASLSFHPSVLPRLRASRRRPMKNFLLRFLLPPVYATLVLLLFNAANADSFRDILGFVGIVLIFAFVFAGLPALAFALIMGRLQRRGFRHGGVRLLTAMLLGLGAGLLIGLMLNSGELLPMFVALGFATGPLVELTVVFLERRRRNPQPRT